MRPGPRPLAISVVAPALLVASLRAGAAGVAVPAPRIPLCPGFRIVTAFAGGNGDYESVKTIVAADSESLFLKVAADLPHDRVVERRRIQRRVLWRDLGTATLYMRWFDNHAALTIPGSTALGTSRAVLRALRTTGHATLGLVEETYSAATADSAQHPNVYDYQTVATIERVGSGTTMVPVLVNGAPTELPAIEARGDFFTERGDFFFLDDDDNPLVLRYRIGRDALDVVQIAFDCAASGSVPPVHNRIEQALLATGRVDVYTIFFAFNSDELRPESDSTLREIDDVLRRHPDWKLGINGHTDSVGGDASNLALSERRAAAVKTALVSRFGDAPARLTTTGYGKRQPKATNATLEGRAMNRRVELVRLP
jgi:outer membrane protein OmpA-like peptidoglycan-associated protein